MLRARGGERLAKEASSHARVSQLRGQLHVRWDVHQQCQLNYQLPADAAGLEPDSRAPNLFP